MLCKNNFKNFFDAIVCDPPYNKRAGIKKHKYQEQEGESLSKG